MLQTQRQLNHFMEKNRLILYGASGHAKVIVDILQLQGIKIDAIIDDNENIKYLETYPVTTPLDMPIQKNDSLLISIGNNRVRKKLSENYNNTFITAIHPKSIIAKTAQIGDGSVVMAFGVINPGAKIGKHVIINTSSVVEHDCQLEDFVHVSPHAILSGGVKVGEGTHIGSGAVIIPNINIGKWATIGAGTVIIRDVPDGATVVGNPGRIIKY